MENLWQRLKPTVKKQILAGEEKYPYMVKEVKVALEANIFWSDLPISTVKQVVNFSHDCLLDVSMNDFMWGDKFIKKA
tara:strand:+ start:163 stop:396 length:234 start_codon:yes stop_codon:yes gene_type:complete